ncbi:MAG: phenylalanine--tRNA ligase subunit beta, partial [Bacteroidales bacterium]|nr:phenylalanine--tRNA ligase subunit beta [Bacteroidales bacterium]
MKISYNWLKRYLSIDLDPSEVEKILTSIGLEVEAMEEVEDIPGGLAGVVVGEVVECAKHPDADKLSVTKVNTGSGELLNIVCGAPNVAAGQKVLVATVGTSLSFSSGETIKIKRSKIRGVESMGMICAEDELGVGTSHEGIMVLPESAVPGTSAKDYLNLKTDTVFEIGLTPNRVDAASHIGVARDLYAYLKYHNHQVSISLPSEDEFKSLPVSASGLKPTKLTVTAFDGAPKYLGLTMDNITVAPSPEWLQNYLRSAGLRPINNVVDITNFVLQETGHPLHAFDYDQIEGGEVVVRRADLGEKFITLDGVERELSAQDLMICDIKKPMCLAGVFGGERSGVTDKTTAVFLESAYFNPVSIRKSSKRHSLKTDASFRFERGANPEVLPYAIKRAAIMLSEIAGAKVVGDITEFSSQEMERAQVQLNFERMEDLIGKKIGAANILSILKLMEY